MPAMADSAPPLDGDPEHGGALLSQISDEVVRAFKQYYGKGPTRAKSYMVDDLLFVVLRGGITAAEETLLEAGQYDVVRDFRQCFENEMASRLKGLIEQLTGRRVLTFQSQILFDPNMSIEMFVFDANVTNEAIMATAGGQTDVADDVGIASKRAISHDNGE